MHPEYHLLFPDNVVRSGQIDTFPQPSKEQILPNPISPEPGELHFYGWVS